MHPRNRHQGRYNLKELAKSVPELLSHININQYRVETIDFSNPHAVKALNKAILKHDYGIKYWELSEDFLCPPIPGRADYIHYMADLIKLKGPQVRLLDIGVGANCIYPLIGHQEYGWSFLGSDISEKALISAESILKQNNLDKSIKLRKQTLPSYIFKGIIRPDEKFTLSICNPPFHASAEEALKGSKRKQKNLGIKEFVLNFGGTSSELWCKGGEIGFVKRMVLESFDFRKQCEWFSCLISKEANLSRVKSDLLQLKAIDIKTIEMSQGQKTARIVAWKW